MNMDNDRFKEKSWAQEQEEARRVMAEQEAAIAASREEAAEKKSASEEPDGFAQDTLDRERGVRMSQMIAAERAQAVMTEEESQAEGAAEIAKLDRQIRSAKKESANGWQASYLMLTVGAGVCDLLQLVGDATVILSIVSSAIGVVFSGTRYLVLRTEMGRMGNAKMGKDMVTRTLISGAVSLIPIVNFVPEQTTAMIIEWQKRRETADAAFFRLDALKRQRAKLMKQLS
jgi:hypothetical protein